MIICKLKALAELKYCKSSYRIEKEEEKAGVADLEEWVVLEILHDDLEVLEGCRFEEVVDVGVDGEEKLGGNNKCKWFTNWRVSMVRRNLKMVWP
jgi:hypothetical protein